MSARDVGHCVLVIHDNSDQRELIRDQLGSRVRMAGAGDGLEGYRLACAERPSAVVLDHPRASTSFNDYRGVAIQHRNRLLPRV